jgi:hypothetical protein
VVGGKAGCAAAGVLAHVGEKAMKITMLACETGQEGGCRERGRVSPDLRAISGRRDPTAPTAGVATSMSVSRLKF